MSEPIYHHYVSAGYLRGFAKSGKHDFVHCVDLVVKKGFPQSVKNVAGEDHFNRLDGHPDPNILERSYANEVEGPGIAALTRVVNSCSFSKIADREAVLLLFSLFAARNPRDRQHLESTIKPFNQVLMASKLGPEALKSPEALAALEMNSSKHAYFELGLIGKIHQCLLERKWRFLQVSNGSPGFITSDYPVNLVAHPGRHDDGWGLGYALRDVSIFIPLSRNIAIFGDYEANERVILLEKTEVAAFNSRTIGNATRQIYAHSDAFEFINLDGNLLIGKDLPQVL